MNLEKTIIVRMTKRDHDRLVKVAERKGRNVSGYVRYMLKEIIWREKAD